MARHLYLVRHGESAFNAEGRVQGQADSALSATGRGQAETLRDRLATLAADHVVASDLSRARETAALAGFGDPELDERWRERAMGEWEDELEADIGREQLRAFRVGDLTPSGGETIPQFVARVGAAVEDLAAREGSWLVFTHGGCVRAATAHLTGAEFNAVAGPANVSLSIVEIAPRRRIVTFNWTAQGGLPRATDPGGADQAGPSGY